MRRLLTLSSSLLLSAAPLAAQQFTVFPSDHRTREGYGGQAYFPFSNGISRQQAIYHRHDLLIPNGARITRAGVRHDATSSTTSARVELQVLMGQTSRDPRPGVPGSIVNTFAYNYDAAPTTVFTTKWVDLPAIPETSVRPSPTHVLVPFDVSFAYDDTRNLVVEWQTSANSRNNEVFSYAMDYANSLSAVAEFGAACATSRSTMPRCSFYETAVGTTCHVSLSNAMASSPASLLLGAAAQPVPLPLDLIGMTGCFLHVAPMVNLMTSTALNGSANVQIPIPDDLFLVRSSVVGQFVTADPQANAAGLVASNGARVTFGVAPLMSLVIANRSTTAPTGGVLFRQGAVSVFEWQ